MEHDKDEIRDIPVLAKQASLGDEAAVPVFTKTDHPSGAVRKDDHSDLESGAVFGQYELIRPLGSGGMGVVHLARDTRLGRRVAIKFLRSDDAVRSARFLAEARATARCEHDNIVTIHEVNETRGYSYMVFEYVQGVTLRTWIAESWRGHGRVSAVQAVEIAIPIVRALAHAHERGLVHRDLKPENVMLTEGGTIKVLDFGIAKVLSKLDLSDPQKSAESMARLVERGYTTLEGVLVGTLPYMSPEQLRGRDVDWRADLWAVGIMIWELVTGRHPLAPVTRPVIQRIMDEGQPMPSLADAPANANGELMRLAKIVDHCLEKRAEERMSSAHALLVELEMLLPGRKTTTSRRGDSAENPYVGLAAFQRSDADRFFGRERDANQLVAKLIRHRMVTVAGASGAGKSSFVRAGVIPALERAGRSWESFIVRPGRKPLAALAEILGQLVRESGQETNARQGAPDAASRDHLVATLRERPGYLGTVLRTRSRERQSRVLLFVDQFEELYTLGADAAVRAGFVACLEGVADDASSPLRVLVAVRSDFLDRVAEDRAFTSEIVRGMTLLAPLARDGLRAALCEPLRAVGYAVEDEDLVETMLDTLEATRAPLPLLQFTAARLWDMRDETHKRLTRASYDALGGIEGALATHADAVLEALSRREQRLARRIITSLVSDERTRTIVSLDELRSTIGGRRADDDDGFERVMHHLAEGRLVLMEADRDAGSTVELTHESLIERWATLKKWLDQDQDTAEFRGRLSAAARQWDQQGRSDDLLWRGQAADEARRWLARADSALADLGPRDRAYLEAVAGLAVRARRQRWQVAAGLLGFLGAITLVVSAGVVALLCAIAIVVSLLAVRSERKAREARREAVRADEKTAEAEKMANEARRSAVQARNASRMASAREHKDDPTLVLALVRELEPADELPPRWRELARWATFQDIARVVLPHRHRVYSAAFSPDGRRIVTASHDTRARLWNADGIGAPLLLEGHRDIVYSAAFSPDGRRIVTASLDGTARVWTTDGTRTDVLRGHEGYVYTAAFAPSGARVATGSQDGKVLVHDLRDGHAEPVALQHPDEIWSVAFSPDGKRIATGSQDGVVRLFQVSGAELVESFSLHSAGINSVAFNPDGSRLVTASWDGRAHIIHLDDPGRWPVLLQHRANVWYAAFRPDGERVVTASHDKIIRVWNADGSGAPLVLEGHQDHVTCAGFSPDGTRIVTASHDTSVRVWTTESTSAGRILRLEGHHDTVRSAEFSPDGTHVVTASFDRTARVWNLAKMRAGIGEPLVLEGHRDAVTSATFSPDGTRIVTASRDNTARVWNLEEMRAGSGQPLVLEGHQENVFSAAFSPDGARVVTASHDRTARVWNLEEMRAGSGQPLVLEGHRESVNSAAFSPDGRRIVTASHDKTARLWNADGTGEPAILEGHQGMLSTAAFSPDGERIVTASHDKTVRIWRLDEVLAGKGEPLILAGHSTSVASGTLSGKGAFSPDGKRVVTLAEDKTLRIWAADGTGEPAILRIPEIEAWTASFSPDGRYIVTTGHGEREPLTGRTRYWATVWPNFERLTDPDDPELWRATTYCPPVELRMELLGVSEKLAREQVARCQTRVAEVRTDAPES